MDFSQLVAELGSHSTVAARNCGIPPVPDSQVPDIPVPAIENPSFVADKDNSPILHENKEKCNITVPVPVPPHLRYSLLAAELKKPPPVLKSV